MIRILLASILLLPSFVGAQIQKPNYLVHVSDSPISFETVNVLSDWEELKDDVSAQFNQQVYALVQFNSIPTSDQKDQLSSLGINLLHYVPNYAWLSEIDPNFDPTQLTGISIRSISAIDASWKISKELRDGTVPEHAQIDENIARGEVIFLKDLSPQERVSILAPFSITLIGKTKLSSSFQIKGEWQKLVNLAAHPMVQYIDFAQPEIQLEYESAVQSDVQNSRTTYISNNPPMGYFFNGLGVAAGIDEGGNVDSAQDPNFKSRLNRTFEIGSGPSGHKTGCAIRAGAAGNIDPRERGVAYNSEIYSGGLTGNNYGIAINNDLRIVSHSYGWGCSSNSTTYNGSSQNYDFLIRTNTSFMVTFSCGNAGGSDCYAGVPGYGNITGIPKMGKNLSLIGSMVHDDNLAGFSSHGPAKDGRILPTVCSPGMGGTSYASPNYAGTFAILNHAYKYHNFGFVPNSGLIKSIIMNSADDVLNHGPDFLTGYGKVNARRAYDIIRLGQHDSGDMIQGMTNSHTLVVPPNAKQVKVMVYWVDWEATAGITTRSIVNDLDILLTDPNMQTYQPWVLNPTFGQATLADPAVRATDSLNNVEQVTILDPVPGTYQLDITGTSIPQGPQAYFMNYDIIYDDIVVIHPHGGEKFVTGGEEAIRWDAFGNTSTFDLLYTIDDGVTWNTIVSGLSSDLRHYDWTIPDHATNLAKVKVVRNSNEGTSDGPFTIYGQPDNLELVWSCADSSLFVWDDQPGVDGYVLYRILGNFMDSVAYTSSNSILLHNFSMTEYEYVSVAGYKSGITGRRMIAIERPPNDVNCVENDAALVELLSPEMQIPSCMTANLPLKVLVQNPGVNALSSIPVAYRLDGGAPVLDTIQATLLSGQYLEFFFTNPPILSGSHLLEVWTEFPLESNFLNDTVSDSIHFYAGTSMSLPLIQDFDAFTNCGTSWNCEGENCLLTEGWKNLQNFIVDDIDWRTHNNATGTVNSGPSGDHTSGAGKYLYLEGSTCYNKEAILHGPCIDLTGTNQPKMSFWYHAYGASIGELHVDILADGQLHEDVITPVIGAQGDQWLNLEADLSPFVGQQIVAVFRGSTGGGFHSDLAIDDINIFTSPLANYSVSDTFVCDLANQIVTLNNASTNADTYEWSISPSNFTYETGTNNTWFEPQVSFTAPGTYTIQLIATNAYGSDTLIYVDQIEVWGGSPDSVVLADLQGNCELIVDTPMTTDNCDGTVSGITSDPTTFNESGNYIISWEFTNSAGNSVFVDQNVIIDAIDVSTTLTNDITLSANNTNASSYQWINCLDGNAIIPGATSASFSPSNNGEYAVVIEENGCTDTSACSVISVISVDEIFGEQLEIFPNPTTGEITLNYDAEQSIVRIEITNVLGQLVDDRTLVNTGSISLNIPGESGVYTIRIFDSFGVHSHKIIKQDNN
ncbi:MAG: S8 family serine peptidase [Crocinitomicaceae bacterium]|nr:S8 family serine peptidase [Crocinitomicaceae bacterium]